MKYRIVKDGKFVVQKKLWILPWRNDQYYFPTIEQAEYRLKELEAGEIMDKRGLMSGKHINFL